MIRKVISYVALLATVLAAGQFLQPFTYLSGLAQAQGDCRTFTETGKTVCGQFLTYWEEHGGLAQQGLPISGEFVEVSDLNGQPYTVQYFERAVFEKHPEFAPPNDILLSQLGTFQFQRKYPNGEPPSGQVPPTFTPVPPPPTQPPAPTAAPEQPLTFQGTTTLNTPPFSLQGGTYEAFWNAVLRESSCYLGIRLEPTGGGFGDLIVNNAISGGDPMSGSTYLYNVEPGQYFLEVTTTGCDWTIRIERR